MRAVQKTELARMRVASGLIQKELADKLGVSANHVAMVERGERVSKSLCERASAILSSKRV